MLLYNESVEDLKSNSELRTEAREWVSQVSIELENDRARPALKLSVLGPFRDPWLHALAIAELKITGLRFKELAPNPSPKRFALQVLHGSNLLDWPPPDLCVIRVRPDNLFDPPLRSAMIEILSKYLAKDVSFGDIHKIDSGWAVSIANGGDIPSELPGYTLRRMTDNEISSLPPSSHTGRKTITVPSPRLDAVSAGALKPSREQIKKHIETGGVLVNYESAKKSGRELMPGDIVAIRDSGRFIFEEFIGETKKGKFQIIVNIING